MNEGAIDPDEGALLEALAKGAWVLDTIGPGFQEALSRRHADHPALLGQPVPSLLVLTLLEYGAIPAGAIPLPLAPYPAEPLVASADPVEQAFWDRLAVRIDPDARARRPEDADRALVEASLSWLKLHAPATSALLRRWLPRLVPVNGAYFGGASDPQAFGCAFLDPDHFELSPERFALSWVHELAHHELFLLNLVDRLMCADAGARLVHAPFQGRPRPAIGRLHAAHALLRMAELEAQAGLSNAAKLDLLGATIETFAPGELTPFAQRLVEEVYAPAASGKSGQR